MTEEKGSKPFGTQKAPRLFELVSGELVFNKLRLGSDWFEYGINQDVVRLIIHEFGHEYSLDHLSSDYHDALYRIGAKLHSLTRSGDRWQREFGFENRCLRSLPTKAGGSG